VAEAATLAGIVAAPERLSPRHAPDKALERRRYVLGQMRDKGWMAPAVHDRLREAPLRLAPAAEEESDLCPEIVPEVVRLLGEVGGERARRGGFSVATSIDPALQTAARKAVRGALDAYAKRQKLEAPFTATQRRLWGAPFQGQPQPYKPYVGLVSATDDAAGSIDVKVGAVLGRVSLRDEERWNPKRLPPSEFTRPGALLRVSLLAEPEPQGRTPLRLELGPEAALVALDVATREVRALVGSYAALPGGLDRATRASRQPGSAFKAFVYGWAIESRRFHAASVLDLPANDAQPARRLLLREALARSDNAAAEALLEQLGAPAVVRFAQAAGIASRLEPTRSLALGAYEVVPIELAAAYATFAGGGEFAPPSMVTRLTGPDGKPIALPQRPPRRRVVDAETAWLVTSLLQSVVERGTGQRARALGRPVAGKTGTTNDARDAWFVGYSPELVAAVWVGYDDSKPLGWGEQGAVTALPAWIDFMRAAHERRPPLEFPRPPAIVGARIDPASGLLAWQGQPDAVEEVFLAGTVPSESAAPDGGLEAGDAAGAGAPDAGSPADGVAVEAAPPAAAPDATAPPKSPEQRIVEAGVEPPPF
jgi:penicillin-binding protein 1A